MNIPIKTRSNEHFTFRELKTSDGILLGEFFESLSDETRSKFGPHPLTKEHATEVLCPQAGKDNTTRYIVASAEKVVGYFIIDFNSYSAEQTRYQSYGVDLNCTLDPVFAPCIRDEYQNKGVASSAMNALLTVLRETGIRSLVLMGGTQIPNTLARKFYTKFGFNEYGEFYTGHNGLDNVDMRLVF